jgi:4-coumarate--CoA ligase
MPLRSPYRDLEIPETNLLDYLYPTSQIPSCKPVWIDAEEPSINLSPKQSLLWVRRLGFGLQKLGIRPGRDVCMIFTPNHVFVPVAYLGIVSAGAAFSGANPAYTVLGRCHMPWVIVSVEVLMNDISLL